MTTRTCIRLATIDDLRDLNGIKREASLVEGEYRDFLLAHPEYLAVSEDEVLAEEVLIAQVDAECVGMIAVGRDAGLEITGLFVKPGMWKGGIGRQLMNHAIAHYGASSRGGVHVVASPDAEGFYHACGFKTLGQTSTRFGSARLMRRREEVVSR